MNQTIRLALGVLLTFSLSFLVACGAPKYAMVSTNLRAQMMQDLERGNLVLDCQFDCYWSHLQALDEHQQRLINGQYQDLAIGVMQIGMEIDIAYYYLGHAAEHLGYLTAAEKYFQRSLSLHRYGKSYNKCKDEHFCRGVDLSIELPQRIEAIGKAIRAKEELEIANKNKAMTPADSATKYQYSSEIFNAEKIMTSAGYDVGPNDGLGDSRFQEALRRYQKDNNLLVTGELNEATRKSLGITIPKPAIARKGKDKIKESEESATPSTQTKIETSTPLITETQKPSKPPPEKTEEPTKRSEKKEPEVSRVNTSVKPLPSSTDQGTITGSTALMAEASVMAESIGDIPRNTTVEILATQGSFYKIRYNGKEGFVHSSFVKK